MRKFTSPYYHTYERICTRCGKSYKFCRAIELYRLHKNRPMNLCTSCIRSDSAKEQQLRMSQEEKDRVASKISISNKEYYKTISDDRRNEMREHLYKAIYGSERRDEIIEKRNKAISDAFKRQSKEEQERRIRMLRESFQKWYENVGRKLMPHQHKEWWESSKGEEYRINLSKKLSDAQYKFLNSLSDEELEARRKHLSDTTKNWWKNMPSKERDDIIKRRSEKIREYWKNISEDDFKEWLEKRATGYNAYVKEMQQRENHCERLFFDMLKTSHLEFTVQEYNETVHPEFFDLYLYNPYSVHHTTSPYHAWDFMIKLKNDQLIFVDIDGSIHDRYQTNFEVRRSGLRYNIADYIQFNDSKREYQTDGLDAYIIKAYWGNLTDDVEVISLSDPYADITFRSFRETVLQIS